MKREIPVCICKLSRSYDDQAALLPGRAEVVELSGITGTNCYLDDVARQQLEEELRRLPVRGIHLIDSGNYHYLTRLWLERLEGDFLLVVFDNHTDMQPPAFGGLLSCGGWVADALETLPGLKYALVAGPDAASCEQARELYPERVCFLTRETLSEQGTEAFREALSALLSLPEAKGLPVYLSIDKDILCPADARTDWSQGEMTLQELLACLEDMKGELHRQGRNLLGADLCGELQDDAAAARLNGAANEALIRCLEEYEFEE